MLLATGWTIKEIKRALHKSKTVPSLIAWRREDKRGEQPCFGTVVYQEREDSPPKSRPHTAKRASTANTGTHTPVTGAATGSRTPRHSIYTTANTKARPILPNRQNFQSVPNFNLDSTMAGSRTRQIRRRQSSLDMGMSDLGFDQNPSNMLGAVPSSFATQMAMAMGGIKGLASSVPRKEDTDGMMGRLMLARIKTLEEGFAEVVKEFRGVRTAGNSSVEGLEIGSFEGRKGKGREKIARKKKDGRGVVARTTQEIDFVDKVTKGVKGAGGEDDDTHGDARFVERSSF
ncbi:hypothetical protein M7I_3855 [Glarea lozoyensis 74030]|uniref:Uncharacterized protein n=1 Tax=Glarea lozoyensis (strain ATCC 74030 / MF5533) TaxID=1104152 RepID=H0EML6_GLAL7|nr:hypothetical protein M7I_3855 [Glarea lozoyensis 74030]